MITILCILKYHLLQLAVTPDILYDLRVDPCNIYMNHDIIRFCAENLPFYWNTGMNSGNPPGNFIPYSHLKFAVERACANDVNKKIMPVIG